jgi:phthiocerol/phenolphthiocerol synthesis type-I polyketide synthase C
MTKRIAIVSYSFRFPNTTSSNYWRDLLNGNNLITEVNDDRFAKDSFNHPDKNHAGTSYTYAAGSIGDVSSFDAQFFGISPREATSIDPHQRLLLEMSWEALENAGIKASSLKGSSCGVFIGMASTDYAHRFADDFAAIDGSTATGTTISIVANRISYIFDLHGPSMIIDTACSSSLVAFHQACRSILSGEITEAFVGGISLHLHPYGFIIFSKASMLSPRGRCTPFDISADGYVRSEGGGMFFIKDYDQALIDGNPILAIVANSGINTDGQKSALTAPSPKAQADLLTQIYKQANIDPATIDYIEAHGTGTSIGDPVEAAALGEALGKHRPAEKPLFIGSVKSNLGHLEAASGVAGLIKALYCLKNRAVPATIGIKKINPAIPFQDLNLKVVTKNQSLKEFGKLIIGINSFGFGGANAHVVLESYEPEKTLSINSSTEKLLPLIISAKDPLALKATAIDFSAYLKEKDESRFYDIIYQAALHREHHPYRAVVYSKTNKQLAKKLLTFANSEPELDQAIIESNSVLDNPFGPAFIYAGNGSQWEGMGKKLLEDPIFILAIEEIDYFFCKLANFSLADELAGKNGKNRYHYTEFAQPALFAIQVGITRMLQNQGIIPIAVAGHSVGEVAAAWASGALTLEDAVTVIYQRSQFQGTTKGSGQMTAVGLGYESISILLRELNLHSKLTIAGINSHKGVTIAGCPNLLTQLESALTNRNIFNKRLELDYAFHSPFMDEIENGIRQTLSNIKPIKTNIPFYSSVTGKLLDGPKLNAEYWWHNIRKTVLFDKSISSIIRKKINIFIEVSPHTVLSGYLKDAIQVTGIEARIFSTITRKNDAPEQINKTSAKTLIAGAIADWNTILPSPGRFIKLPNYPWQRQPHWHKTTSESIGLLYRHNIHPLLGHLLQQHELTWENQLDITLNPVLADHVVGGATVFPGAGFCELAVAAALEWKPCTLAEIEELQIHAPLLLSTENTKLIRVIINPKNGYLSIKSRNYNSNDSWTLNVSAQILSEPNNVLQRQSSPLAPSRQPDFTQADHKLLTNANDLTYGPAFQCISHGWIDDNSVIGVFKSPETSSNELKDTYLHPAFLDCSFQLVFHILKNQRSDLDTISYVPIKIGRITLETSKVQPAFAQARIIHHTTRSILADFIISDSTGHVITFIEHVRFQSIRLNKKAQDKISYINYCSISSPLISNVSSSLIPFNNIHEAFVKMVRQTHVKGNYLIYSEEIEPLLDSLCSIFTLEMLKELSINNKTLSFQEINSLQNTNPDCKPFISYLVQLAESDTLLTPIDNGWEILTQEETQTTAQDIWYSLITEHPSYFNIIHSVGRIGMHLKALLEGRISSSNIQSQDISRSSILNQILGSDGKQKITNTLKQVITSGLKELPEGQILSIMEISQDPPLFIRETSIAIETVNCRYFFASTSKLTLEKTVLNKEEHPIIELIHIDNFSEQSKSTTKCDLVILTLDFESRDKAEEGISFAANNLKSDGTLIIIGQHPSRSIDFIFGHQTENWQLNENDQWFSKQSTPEFWRSKLEQGHFLHTNILEVNPDKYSGPYFIVAQRDRNSSSLQPKKNKPCSWIILADTSEYVTTLSSQLTKKLQLQGDLVIQACPTDLDHFEALLISSKKHFGQLDGIIHLAGLIPPSPNSQADDILNQQVQRCSIAANILQACENTQNKTTYWIITTGAATHLLPKTVLSITNRQAKNKTISPDAALWGFGQSMHNEASNINIRLIDLEDIETIDNVVNALDREFHQVDNNELEIIITKNGGRYATRLHLEDKPSSPEASITISDEQTLNLGFEFPGQLRNLRWEAYPRNSPSQDEVEVTIHATGLNFRDVMYTLGLLPEEALENGFSGPSLGLEFSGVITGHGSNSKNFAIGDRVLGFGPSSFSNRTITKANAISLIPHGMSFEEAATIPSTFFTVYYALHHLARLQPGEKILIHGAAGGIGLAAIQVAQWIGADIYATAGSNEKRDFLHLLGIKHIYDSRSLAFADEINVHTNGKGLDVILNSLSGEAINRNFRILKPFGRFLELGKRDFYENTNIGLRPFRNNISYFGIDADQLLSLQPELTQCLFTDMMTLFTTGIFHPLPYKTFLADEIVDAFRYMQQARQIGKVVISYRNGINRIHNQKQLTQKQLVLSDNISFLVTGGLSGFGLITAEWLVSKGVRNLILISRRGPTTEEAKNTIHRLTNQGVKIHALACDITDKIALSKLLADIKTKLPPLKGIIHAANVINDGLIRNIDEIKIRNVLAPKALGAYNLHEITADITLDYFILFSSATTLFGNPGQASYIAANTCLEALANQRRANGLAATCVRFGAIDDVGFLASHKKIKDALVSRMGGAAIKASIALDALENMLIYNRSNISVLDFNWQTLSKFLPGSNSPKFSEFTKNLSELNDKENNSDNIQTLLEKLTEEDLLDTLVQMLKIEVGEILLIDPRKINPTHSIYDMGLDSLMGVELVIALEARFGFRLPVMSLSENPTILKLTKLITTELKKINGQESMIDKISIASQSEYIIAKHGIKKEDLSRTTIEDVFIEPSQTVKRIIN